MLLTATVLRRSVGAVRAGAHALANRGSPQVRQMRQLFFRSDRSQACIVEANSVRVEPNADWVTIDNQEIKWLDDHEIPGVVKVSVSIEGLNMRKTGHLRAVGTAILDDAFVLYISGMRAVVIPQGLYDTHPGADETVIKADTVLAKNVKVTFHYTEDVCLEGGSSRFKKAAFHKTTNKEPGSKFGSMRFFDREISPKVQSANLPAIAEVDAAFRKTEDKEPGSKNVPTHIAESATTPKVQDAKPPAIADDVQSDVPETLAQGESKVSKIGNIFEKQSIVAGMRSLGVVIADALVGSNKK